MTETNPGPRPRTGGRSARVRAAVLSATVALLEEGGPEQLSIAAVAERAGVHETSIYRRWGTVPDLALAAILSRVEAEIPLPGTGALRSDLLALLRPAAAFMQTPVGRTLIQLALRSDQRAEYRQARDAFWTRRFELAGQLLERAEVRGELRPGVDRRAAIEMLIAPLHLRLLLTGEPLDDGYLTQVVDLLLAGIGAAPA